MPIGFGIIGCGMIARFHAIALGEIPSARLVGCWSRRSESSRKLAGEFGVRDYPTLETMLLDPRIDVVTVCTPSGAHVEPAVAAARAGKHILVEKPLEITAERCDEILAAAADSNVQVATIFPSRFHPCWRVVRETIARGRFGTLMLGDAFVKWFRTQQYYDSGDWRGTWKLDGGGALMNQAIHTVDLLLWLLGDVSEVTAAVATRAHQRIEVEDVAVATLRFRNGCLGVIEATTGSFPGQFKRIEIHGSGGSAIIEEDEIKYWKFSEESAEDAEVLRQFGVPPQSGGGAGDPKSINHHSHALQFQDFINAIQSGASPTLAGKEGRRSVELINAIYKAARSRQTIVL